MLVNPNFEIRNNPQSKMVKLQRLMVGVGVTTLTLLRILDVLRVYESVVGIKVLNHIDSSRNDLPVGVTTQQFSIVDVHHSKDISSDIISRRNTPVTTQGSLALNDTRPVLVILVGPPKTATTTLQMHLSDPRIQADLRKDNYLYQGRRLGARQTPLLRTLTDRRCKDKTKRARKNKKAMPECWNSFTDELDRLHQNGQNVILVEEYLSDASFDLPSFQQATTKWQVLIVVTYRQFWSWLPSFKNQFEKNIHKVALSSFERKSSDPLPWLLDRSRTTSSPEFYKAMTSVKNRKEIRVASVMSGKYLPYTDNIMDLYRELGDQVRIMNIHIENMKVTSNFFCEILPNAPNTCHDPLHQTNRQSFNPSIPMDYQLIAVDAVDRGLLGQSKFNRSQVVTILEQHHKGMLESRPLPLECMDQASLEAFLAESMRLERELVPDFYAAHEEQHRKSFWNAAAQNKFCSVNTTAVLIDPDWLSIFVQLENE
jgi:hypothetical protein